MNDKLFKTQLKDIFQAWRRDRDDLTTQVKHLIQEAQYKYEESTEKALLHQKQKFICENLHEKVKSPLSILSATLWWKLL